MRILIYEPEHSGHRLNYVRHLANAASGLGQVDVVLGREAPASPEFAVSLAALANSIRIHPEVAKVRATTTGRAADKWRAFVAALFRHRPDHVFVPYGDGLAQLHGALPLKPRQVEIEGLLMRGSFAYAAGGRARLAGELSLRLAGQAPWATLHHLDPIVWEALQRRGAGRWRLMPDPVEAPALDRAESRASWGLPADARIVGCAGPIDERKGMDLLLQAFASAAGPDDHLLLAGRLSPGLRRALGALPQVLARRVHAPDRFLDDASFSAALAAMDLVCTPYPDHVGSASIVLRAAAAGRPVLAADTGWMGRFVPRFGLGRTVAVRDAEAFRSALAQALDEAAEHRPGAAAAAFVRFHSQENFAACWTARLRERLGQQQAAGRVDWDELVGR